MSLKGTEFIKKATHLKRQLENDLRFEFLKYLENIKAQGEADQTTSNLRRQIKAAIQLLPGFSSAKTSFDTPNT